MPVSVELQDKTETSLQDGPNWRPKAIATGGKKQFPYLQDPNTGVVRRFPAPLFQPAELTKSSGMLRKPQSMYESDDIINYLASAYGDGTVPLALRMGPLTGVLCGLSLIPRGGAGSMYRPSKVTESTIPLEYYGYEARGLTILPLRGNAPDANLGMLSYCIAGVSILQNCAVHPVRAGGPACLVLVRKGEPQAPGLPRGTRHLSGE